MKTPAERQAAYRRKHLHDEGGTKTRLNVIMDYRAKLALARLAKHYSVTQADLLARLILDEQTRSVADMTADAQNAYYDSVTP